VRASDDAMWLSEPGCRIVSRVSPSTTTSVELPFEPDDLAADPSGGVWALEDVESRNAVAHVDAGGHVSTFELPDYTRVARDVAVAPDGSAWFAAALCRLVRLPPAGEITVTGGPIHADELGFDAAGGRWLKGGSRLAYLAP